MRESLISNRIGAIARARDWLEQASTPTSEAISLRQLGLMLCDHVTNGASCLKIKGSGTVTMPVPENFIQMRRRELLDLLRRITLAGSPPACLDEEENRQYWAPIFGAVALSYAMVGDLSVVASLVRVAAHLSLREPWLDDAEMYLIDQQQIDGGFGPLNSEFTLLRNEDSTAEARLRFTVEVLLALGETTSLWEVD